MHTMDTNLGFVTMRLVNIGLGLGPDKVVFAGANLKVILHNTQVYLGVEATL